MSMRSAMMVRALHVIVRAVHEWTVAVPKSRTDTMPPYSFVLEVPADAVPGLTVMRALEENMGAVATLIPADVAVVVDARDLRVLLQIAENSVRTGVGSHTVMSPWTVESLRAGGMATLDAWSRSREYEREREGS